MLRKERLSELRRSVAAAQFAGIERSENEEQRGCDEFELVARTTTQRSCGEVRVTRDTTQFRGAKSRRSVAAARLNTAKLQQRRPGLTRTGLKLHDALRAGYFLAQAFFKRPKPGK